MTPKQQYRYWVLWSKACAARGWNKQDRELRHQMHQKALDYDTSHKHMDNREVDRVFKMLELIADPDNLDAVLFFQNPEREEKKRLLWRIERTAPKRYIQRIASDKFGTIFYEDLDVQQLEHLRNTLTNRMRKKHQASDVRGSQQPVCQPAEMELALA